MSLWHTFGVVSIFCCIPYIYLIEKTPANWFRVACLSADCLVRLFWPSCYTPIKQSSDSWISSPYFARFLATLAEPFVLEAQAAAMGIPFWYHPMGWLTIAGEVISWIAILTQIKLIAFTEDFTWMIV